MTRRRLVAGGLATLLLLAAVVVAQTATAMVGAEMVDRGIRLASAPATAAAAVAGQNGRIFFHSTQSPNGDHEIYWMNPDGSSQTNLTNAPAAVDAYPSASPDGQRIAFARSSSGGDWEIYAIDADGSDLTRLTNQVGCDLTPSWSPDGQKIAFVSQRGGSGQIFVMNADGTNPTVLPGTSGGCGSSAGNPAWSPDGQRIAFEGIHTGNPEIFVINADGTGLTNLTSNSANDGDPSWSPDGQKLAFHSDRASSPATFEIFTMNADGTGQARLTTAGQNDSQPSWSPDGQKIAFDTLAGTVQESRRDIAVVNVDGGGRTVLTGNTDSDGTPDWAFGGPLTPPDATAPTVTIATPLDGAAYARGAVVVADYSCADEPGGSGLVSCEGDLPSGSAINTSSLGAGSLTVTGTDAAGNQTTKTVSYTVTDRTAPTVSITAPRDGANYRMLSAVVVNYSCADDTGGSGLASCVGTRPDGSRLPTGPGALGNHTFTVTATDRAGNTTTVTHSYRVSLLGR